MLCDVVFDRQGEDWLLRLESTMTTRIEKGVYLTETFNFDHMIANKRSGWHGIEFNPNQALFAQRLHKRSPENYPAYTGPNPQVLTDLHKTEKLINEYGVVDSPEQLRALYDFEADPRQLAISFVLLEKKNMAPEGGWRWHKWGPYLGTQNPQCEYLYDEPDIYEVYVYHIYELV